MLKEVRLNSLRRPSAMLSAVDIELRMHVLLYIIVAIHLHEWYIGRYIVKPWIHWLFVSCFVLF